jgi:putative membrane protein
MSTSTAEGSANTPERSGFSISGWILALLGVVVVGAAAFAVGFAVSRHDRGGERRFGGPLAEHDGGGRGLGLLVLLILIALVVAAVVFLARRSATQRRGVKTSAEDLLAERFARGEIDEADYVSRRDALRR